MHSSYYRGCWHELSPCFLRGSVNLAVSSPPTAVYNPRAFIPHAASLGQACAHCRRFSTAATRRCLGSVSVPVVGVALSRPLDVYGLVGRYPTNYLISHRPLLPRRTFALSRLSGINHSFPWLFPSRGYVPMPYYPVRRSSSPLRDLVARLACLIHAANVHSEPGSNPSIDCLKQRLRI